MTKKAPGTTGRFLLVAQTPAPPGAGVLILAYLTICHRWLAQPVFSVCVNTPAQRPSDE